MYAVFVQVKVDNYDPQAARDEITMMAIPATRETGAVAGHWLAPSEGRVTAISLYADEDQARKAADGLKVGSQAGADPGTTFDSVEVREVLAQF